MTALAWWLITNSLTQAIAGGLALASLVVAVVGRWFPYSKGVAATARVVSYVAVLVLGLGIGFRAADETAALRQAQTDLAFARLQLETQRQTADVAAKLRAAAQADADAANAKVTDYETWLEGKPADCGCAHDADDVRRLRDIAE
ncbi:MAG: hypothetical protein WBB98_10805 [Xanthobacteraceae bacterium]